MSKTSAAPELVKMATLAERSGVPAATIKHYLREGLLPETRLKTSRNVAFYDVALIERVRAIKDLQRTHFLPLRVIKGVLDGTPEGADEETASAIRRVLEGARPEAAESRTKTQLLASGMPARELALFKSLGLVTPDVRSDEETYAGDDLALLQTLGAARKAGISAEMLPPETLQPYVSAIRELVRTELKMFREGVLPRAGRELAPIAEAATKLSEQLVVLVRRKMLLPTLRQLVAEAQSNESKKSAKPTAAKGQARAKAGHKMKRTR